MLLIQKKSLLNQRPASQFPKWPMKPHGEALYFLYIISFFSCMLGAMILCLYFKYKVFSLFEGQHALMFYIWLELTPRHKTNTKVKENYMQNSEFETWTKHNGTQDPRGIPRHVLSSTWAWTDGWRHRKQRQVCKDNKIKAKLSFNALFPQVHLHFRCSKKIRSHTT